MNAKLTITEPNGRRFEIDIDSTRRYTIGRSKDNDVVLNDRRVSRKHAFVDGEGERFRLIDGVDEGGQISRSVNRVFVNGTPQLEKLLEIGDIITIGESSIEYGLVTKSELDIHVDPQPEEKPQPTSPPAVKYEDTPLGHTQVKMSASEIIGRHSHLVLDSPEISADEVKDLRRKAKILELMFEMSKTLGTVFDLETIFERATDLIFRGSPADRVIALLADETVDGKILSYSLYQIAAKTRDEGIAKLSEKMSVSRTITQKVMDERVAILSQDAKTDEQFQGSESIVSQGIRSTICAPLVTESNVHGVIYADRLDPFAAFTQDHLELISAIAAQAAVTVETIKAHKRLAREEVARANYSRFMPEYVVQQLLEHPNSFRLGGSNQTVTVLFADIRGFTALSEHENPEKVVGLLNHYFSAMTEIIFAHGGTLDKYIGDGLMALFGAPTTTPVDPINAVKAAVSMQKRIVKLNEELRDEGYPALSAGIGLHTGVATVGYIGSDKRSEYTAIGDTVNLAARLESNATGGQILLSEATQTAAGNIFPVEPLSPLVVKNRQQPVALFELKWQ